MHKVIRKMDHHDIHFVHYALPDMALGDADTSMRIGSITLDAPVLVMVNKAREAALAERKYGMNAVLATKGGVRAFKSGRSTLLRGYVLHKVNDGLEAAKVIRIDKKSIPYVTLGTARRSGEILKQLKIAMFLTNSKSISELKRAPIYEG
ncbi:MAG: hypothetical protein ACP5UH_01830 [Candidatus Micrarchaeia archaeon]